MQVKEPGIAEKPWGKEIWVAHEEEYAGKIIEINKGYRTSFHKHEHKKETMYVMEGTLRILNLENMQMVVEQGESVTIEEDEVHSLEALEDLKIFEVSLPYLEDVIRVKDDYGRAEKQ